MSLDRVVYLHNLKFPFFADFEHPENYGLARECVFSSYEIN